MIDMSMSAERYNLRPVTLIMTKTSQPEKTTDFSLRHYWFPREVTSEKLHKLIRNSILMTRHYSDLGSASDWWKVCFFCSRFSGVISQGNQ